MDIGLGLSDIMSTPELNCDVACLLYDITNPKSFEVCARIYKVSSSLLYWLFIAMYFPLCCLYM